MIDAPECRDQSDPKTETKASARPTLRRQSAPYFVASSPVLIVARLRTSENNPPAYPYAPKSLRCPEIRTKLCPLALSRVLTLKNTCSQEQFEEGVEPCQSMW